MSRWNWIALLALFFGCSNSSETSGSESAQTSAEQNASSEAAETARETTAPAAEEAEDGARDLAGIRALVNDDGTITLSGADRWGNPIDATYADTQYLENAVPVLTRSITEEQATALAGLVEELKGEGGEAPIPEAAGGDGEE